MVDTVICGSDAISEMTYATCHDALDGIIDNINTECCNVGASVIQRECGGAIEQYKIDDIMNSCKPVTPINNIFDSMGPTESVYNELSQRVNEMENDISRIITDVDAPKITEGEICITSRSCDTGLQCVGDASGTRDYMRCMQIPPIQPCDAYMNNEEGCKDTSVPYGSTDSDSPSKRCTWTSTETPMEARVAEWVFDPQDFSFSNIVTDGTEGNGICEDKPAAPGAASCNTLVDTATETPCTNRDDCIWGITSTSMTGRDTYSCVAVGADSKCMNPLKGSWLLP